MVTFTLRGKEKTKPIFEISETPGAILLKFGMRGTDSGGPPQQKSSSFKQAA